MLALLPLVISMMAAGYALRRLGWLKPEQTRPLNLAVLYLTLPALIFTALYRSRLEWSLLAMPLAGWAATAVGAALGIALVRALKLPPLVAGPVVIGITFGNTTYFGYPIAQAFFGTQGLTLAIFYDLLGASVAAYSAGPLIAGAYGNEARTGVLALLKRLATLPTMWAMGLGLALHAVPIPAFPLQLLEWVGMLTSPIIMLSIGVQLRFASWREDLPLALLVSLGRLVVVPAIVLGALLLIGGSVEHRQVAVLQSAMPCMFFSLTLAVVGGLRANLTVHCIMATTALSFVTLPVWRWVLG